MREVRMLCWFASAAVLASAPVFAAQGSSSPRVQPAPMSALVHPVRPLAGVSVAASGTSSSPQALKSGHAPIAATVALLETTSVGLSVARALTELGISYDEYSGSDFSAVNLAPYQAVILAMDGGAIEDPTIANIQGYVSGGGKVLFVGGTCYQPFALAVEARLLDIDSVNYCWTTVAGSPDLTVVNAGHVLAKGLPATYDFIDTSATYYMARNQDGAASVAAVNGDGFAALLSKTIGSGTFDWFINSPYDFYWSNDPDYQILKQIVKNALLGNSVILIHTTSVAGSVGQALTDLGVGYDDFSGSDFSAVDLTSYQTVIVAMDGGVVQDPSVANIQSFANNGGNLVMFGGSALIDFATAVDTRLLDIDLSNYFWITVSSSPNFSVTDAGHRLSQALPATYDYANISASYYMIRNQDGAAQVAAQNGDGFDDLLSKPLGNGRLTWFINSPFDGYWADPSDYALLKQVVKNSLCTTTGSWTNYGAGWPGTGGVPALTATRNPVVGENLGVNVGNSLGATTTGILLLGLSSASISTNLDGTLLVLFSTIIPVPVIPSGGVTLTAPVPDFAVLVGLPVYLQLLEADAGATKGVSFSRGLQLVFGDC